MKHKLRRSLSILMAAVMSVQMFLPAVHAVESAPAQSGQLLAATQAGQIVQLDDRDPSIKYSTGWHPYDEAGHINNTITYTTQVGATMDFTFQGAGVVLYGQKTTNSGTLGISIDGGAAVEVDFYDSAAQGLKKVPVFRVENLDPNVEHTMHAVLLEKKNPAARAQQVALDAIDVLPGQDPSGRPTLEGEAIVFQSAFDKGEMGEWQYSTGTTVELVQDAELNEKVLKITPSVHNEFIDLLSAGKLQNGRISMKIKSEQPLGQGGAVRHVSAANGIFANCWSNGWWIGNDSQNKWFEFSKAEAPAANEWHDTTIIFNGDHYVVQYDDVKWEGDYQGFGTAAGYCGIQLKDGESRHPVFVTDLVVTTTDPGSLEPDTSEHDNTMKLWYKAPGTDWETQALPLGNGYMGAMFYGQVADEKIQINDKTLWQGGPGGVDDYTGGVKEGAYLNLEPMRQALRDGNDAQVRQYANGLIGKDLSTNGWGAYQNLGDILFHFDIRPGSKITNYRRELDLNTGLGGVFYSLDNVNYAREYLVSYPGNVMAFRFTADQDGKLGFILDPQVDDVYPAGRPDTPPNVDPSQPCKTFTRTASQIDDQNALITIRGVVVENGLEFEAQYRVVANSGTVTANEDGTVTISKSGDVVVYVATGTNYANESEQWTELHNPPDYRGVDPHADITARITKAVNDGYEAVKTAHVNDVSTIMSRVDLDIAQGANDIPTDELVNGYGDNDHYDRMAEVLMFQMGRYMILGSSRDHTLPANLQGVWNDDNKPAWSGDYHCNVNLQMNYWPTGIANVDEATQSLVDYMESIVVPGRFTAAEHHGVKDGGWTVHTSNNPFGMTAPGWSFYWGWSPAANAWMCQNLWDIYQFNQNKTVLKEQIYPIMREAAEFWTKNLVDDGHGGLVSSPTYSPEHGPITEGNAYEQCLIYQLMNDTVEAAEALGIRNTTDKAFCDQLVDIKNKLHPYAIGKWGQIKEWREEDEWADRFTHGEERGHRHMSHMLGLYPGNQITRDTPELYEAAKVTLTDRGDGGTGWSKALKVSNWARVGDGNHALKIFHEFLVNNVNTNLFAVHPPYQIDGNLGITAGAAEMLLQSHTGYIQPLPALPDDWSAKGSVKGLVARGNFVVDMTWEQGILHTMDVTARADGDCKIYLPRFDETKNLPANGSYDAETKILTISGMKKEDTYHYEYDLPSADEMAAIQVDRKINSIGTVTLGSEKVIAEARAAYEVLSPEQKLMVTKLRELADAEERLVELQVEAYGARPLNRTGWTAIADSYHNPSGPNDGPAQNLLDGDVNSIWHTNYGGGTGDQAFPYSVIIDTKQESTFKGFAYTPRQNGVEMNGNILGYELWSSDQAGELDWNDPSWKKVTEGEFQYDGVKPISVILDDFVIARQVKFVAVSSKNGQSFAGGAEFNLLNDPNPPLLKIAKSNVVLGSSLKMQFALNTADLVGRPFLRAMVSKLDPNGGRPNITTVANWKTNADGTLKYVTYDRLSAKEMSNDLEVVLYTNEGMAVSDTYTTSVQDYARRILSNSDSKIQNDQELRTAVVDMLNYGTAAQKYFKFNETKLANSILSDAEKALATKSAPAADHRVVDENYVTTSLSLDSTITLNMYFKDSLGDVVDRAVVTYEDHYGDQKSVTYYRNEFVAMKSFHALGVPMDELAVADGRQLVTCTLQDVDGNVVAQFSDSVEGYVARALEKSQDQNLKTVLGELMKFVDSSAKYFDTRPQ